jgi:hypothetical protein
MCRGFIANDEGNTSHPFLKRLVSIRMIEAGFG